MFGACVCWGEGGKGILSGRSRGGSGGPHLPPSDLRVFSLLVGSQNYFREGLHLTTQLEVQKFTEYIEIFVLAFLGSSVKMFCAF